MFLISFTKKLYLQYFMHKHSPNSTQITIKTAPPPPTPTTRPTIRATIDGGCPIPVDIVVDDEDIDVST